MLALARVLAFGRLLALALLAFAFALALALGPGLVRRRLAVASLGLFVAALGLLVATAGSNASLLVNELLYDPAGPDAGQEFVELVNTSVFAAPLDGLTVEAGNGSHPGEWKTVWRGGSGRAIPPGGFYRIGAPGPGQGEEADLGLQNGPDAIRLCKNGVVLDRIGYGAPLDPSFVEGRPAPAARSGCSLARRFDGIDTDDNSADFESARPSPGRPNRPDEDWSARWLAISPERPREGAEVVARIAVTNRGRFRGPAPDVELETQGAGAVVVGFGETLEPGEERERVVRLRAPSDPGETRWTVRIASRDPVPENDADTLRVGVGAAPVRVTEVMARPHENGCEWIEIALASPRQPPDSTVAAPGAFGVGGRRAGAAILEFSIEVRGRSIRPTEAARARFAADSSAEGGAVALVAEDSLRMLAAHPGLDAARLLSYEGSWPRLRNDASDGGIADTIRLRDARGIVLDAAMPGPSPAAGISLERWGSGSAESPSDWIACTDPAGSSPGALGSPSRDPIAAAEGIAVRPRVLSPGEDRCEIQAEIGSEPATVDLRILDLCGATRRCLLSGLKVAGRLVAFWDGTDEQSRPARPGLYVVVLEMERAGKREQARRAAIAVAPPGSSR